MAGSAAVGLFLIRPSVPTDDTYASLDWGRDLIGGWAPSIQNRTFHPLLVAAGGALSPFGSVAPTLVVVLCLAAYMSLPLAGWRVVHLLGFAQPAPALASFLLFASPLLPVLAFVAYNDILFAVCIMWAIAFDLQQRPGRAWGLLSIAGLIRPEAWVFSGTYAALRWLDAGKPHDLRPCLSFAARAVAPALLWLASEWALFGDPLYSYRHLAGTPTRLSGLQNASIEVRGAITWVVVAFAISGAAGVVSLAPKRAARVVLTMLAASVFSVALLEPLRLPRPSRHLAAIAALAATLAAIGAVSPGMMVSRRFPSSHRLLIGGLIAVGTAVLATLALGRSVRSYPFYFKTIGATRANVVGLARTVTKPLLAKADPGIAPHSIAILGDSERPELAWSLGVPFDATSNDLEPRTRMIVEPSQASWLALRRLNLTSKRRWIPAPGWVKISNGTWEVYMKANGRRYWRDAARRGGHTSRTDGFVMVLLAQNSHIRRARVRP